ncbi:MAG: hypothetical protein ICV83_14860 [Cytophagales bacterium]|nr:hypothetical protein [Cytophagales bacterium]
MTNHWIKTLLFKVLAFVLPFALWLAVDAFVLPPHFFTFRAWEALKVKTFYPTLTGPFYPNQYLELTEQGELAPYTPYAVPKRNVWITDAYGYRNRPSAAKPEVLLLGDSFTAGVKLSQEELLSEALRNRLGRPVYAVAPAPGNFALMNLFLATDRLHQTPPRVVVLERNEGYLSLMKPIDSAEIAYIKSVYERAAHLPKEKVAGQLAIAADRFEKRNWYQWAASRLDRALAPPQPNVYGGEVFTFGPEALREMPGTELNRLTEIITSYRDTLADMGIGFVYVPVPNKETIYHRLLPSGRLPASLGRLISRLRADGVHVVDLQTPFDSAYAAGTALYPRDDGHWNGTAVQIAAGRISREVEVLLTQPGRTARKGSIRVVKCQ